MKLQEAIQTTKRFKRPHHESWFDPSKIGAPYLSWESALADDWEVEPEKQVTISKADLLSAACRVNDDPKFDGIIRRYEVEALTHALGL